MLTIMTDGLSATPPLSRYVVSHTPTKVLARLQVSRRSTIRFSVGTNGATVRCRDKRRPRVLPGCESRRIALISVVAQCFTNIVLRGIQLPIPPHSRVKVLGREKLSYYLDVASTGSKIPIARVADALHIGISSGVCGQSQSPPGCVSHGALMILTEGFDANRCAKFVYIANTALFAYWSH
jgi:hypothetical protein